MKKKGAKAMEAMAKIHMVMLVKEGMTLCPHLHDLLLNYAV